MIFIEPLRDTKKLTDYLDSGEYSKVGIFFGHGVGDCIQFRVILDKLKQLYPSISFKMILQKGLDEEIFYPDCLFGNSIENIKESNYDLDLVASIHFPVEVPGLTKSELCCIEELGIEPIWGHKPLPIYPSKLIAVHFNLTSIPEAVKPSEEVAEKIWNEIREAGYIPIETHFSHVFDNPENKMFPFIDCTVRKCKPKMESLLGLISSCAGFIGVVSGPFHAALSILPIERICYLEKNIEVECFTKKPVYKIDLLNYKDGDTKRWLENMPM